MTGRVDDIAREALLLAAPRLLFSGAVSLAHSAIGSNASAERR
jgi:hypothetical protein